jgi:hypothetical protein
MWNQAVQVRKAARAILSSIGKRRGGERSVCDIIKYNIQNPVIRYPDLITRLEAEVKSEGTPREVFERVQL